MHLSGILVAADPEQLDACRRELESIRGVEVHHEHEPSGRMIAVLESATLAGQEEGLRRIQALPSVRLAALVEHWVDAPPGPIEEPPGRLEGEPPNAIDEPRHPIDGTADAGAEGTGSAGRAAQPGEEEDHAWR